MPVEVDAKESYKRVEKLARESGASLFGVADVRQLKSEFRLPAQSTQGMDRGISIGVRLSKGILETIEDRPTKLYYHHYRQVNSLLDQIALKVASFIQEDGYRALPIPASQIIDWERQRGHLSHKKVARVSGLGWMGRNNLLVSPEFGAQVRLVTILTDMELPCGRPLERDCDNCKACLTVCPAGAIKESQVEFDYRRCFEKLREFRNQGLVGQFVCGVCVKACSGNSS